MSCDGVHILQSTVFSQAQVFIALHNIYIHIYVVVCTNNCMHEYISKICLPLHIYIYLKL